VGMMEDMLSIKVQIAERFYPLKIKRQDEEKIRKASKLINDKVLQYKQRYTDKDTQDFMAMAALQFVISNSVLIHINEFARIVSSIIFETQHLLNWSKARIVQSRPKFRFAGILNYSDIGNLT
jgi:cell division protein ZapA